MDEKTLAEVLAVLEMFQMATEDYGPCPEGSECGSAWCDKLRRALARSREMGLGIYSGRPVLTLLAASAQA